MMSSSGPSRTAKALIGVGAPLPMAMTAMTMAKTMGIFGSWLFITGIIGKKRRENRYIDCSFCTIGRFAVKMLLKGKNL